MPAVWTRLGLPASRASCATGPLGDETLENPENRASCTPIVLLYVTIGLGSQIKKYQTSPNPRSVA
jgi:hypothetical protein